MEKSNKSKIFSTAVNFTKIWQAAFALISICQKLQTQTVSTEKLGKTLLFEKDAHKMLVKLTPAINFNNILCAQIPKVQEDSQVKQFFLQFRDLNV